MNDDVSGSASQQDGPRIGYPQLGTATARALELSGVTLTEQRPLPVMTEPESPRVLNPSDEPMVQLEHPRIKIVPYYTLGGWANVTTGCWLRADVAARVVAAVDKLPGPFGFAVFDGWRSRALQSELYEVAIADPTISPDLFAVPSDDPELPAPHETGGAVDLTLTVGGHMIAAGTDFDDPTSRAAADAFENVPGPDREARRMLYWAMWSAGFSVFAGEWWHFEHGTRRWSCFHGTAPRYGPANPPG